MLLQSAWQHDSTWHKRRSPAVPPGLTNPHVGWPSWSCARVPAIVGAGRRHTWLVGLINWFKMHRYSHLHPSFVACWFDHFDSLLACRWCILSWHSANDANAHKSTKVVEPYLTHPEIFHNPGYPASHPLDKTSPPSRRASYRYDTGDAPVCKPEWRVQLLRSLNVP